MIDYQYNPANQLTREVSNINGVTRYRYDANGNMIQKRCRWRITRYVYDIEDRLRLAFGPEGLGFYLHDALGRRILRFGIPFKHKEAPHFSAGIKKREKRRHRDPDNRQLQRWLDIIAMNLESGCRYGFPHLVRLMDGIKCRLPRKFRRRIVLERYFYDGADVIADYDLFGRRCKASYLTPFLDENLLLERCSRFGCIRRYWYTQDGLGSIRQLVSDRGTVLNSYSYTSWGVPLNWHERIPNRYTFTAREYNPESGDYYYRARHYAPCIGRFLSRDPISRGYSYCDATPVDFVDPFGAWKQLPKAIVPQVVDIFRKRIIESWLTDFPPPRDIARNLLIILTGLVFWRHKIDIWQAEAGDQGDTLPEAATWLCGGKAKDWQCIWPVRMRTKDLRRVSVGDCFDFSWFFPSKRAKIALSLVGNRGKEILERLMPRSVFKVYQTDDPIWWVRVWSLEGLTPLGELVLFGHGISGGGPTTIGVGRPNRVVTSGDWKEVDKDLSYERAAACRGPLWCWFGKTGKIYLLGCETADVARFWSQEVSFRSGTRIYGLPFRMRTAVYFWRGIYTRKKVKVRGRAKIITVRATQWWQLGVSKVWERYVVP